MNNTLKNIAIWALVGFLVFLILDFFKSNQSTTTTSTISYSQFLSQIEKGSVSNVEVRGNNIKGTYSNGAQFNTYSPGDSNLIERLQSNNIEIIAMPPEGNSPSLFDVLISWFPINQNDPHRVSHHCSMAMLVVS